MENEPKREETPPKGHHDRKVSWGGDVIVTGGEKGDVELLCRASGEVKQDISVADVIGGSTPAEQEVETRILKSVEKIDLNQLEDPREMETQGLLADIAAEEIARAQEDRAKKEAELSAAISAATGGSMENSASDDAATSSQRSAKRPSAVKIAKKKVHKQEESVEKRLFGLTAALSKMDLGNRE
jgi:hypothetical protein